VAGRLNSEQSNEIKKMITPNNQPTTNAPLTSIWKEIPYEQDPSVVLILAAVVVIAGYCPAVRHAQAGTCPSGGGCGLRHVWAPAVLRVGSIDMCKLAVHIFMMPYSQGPRGQNVPQPPTTPLGQVPAWRCRTAGQYPLRSQPPQRGSHKAWILFIRNLLPD